MSQTLAVIKNIRTISNASGYISQPLNRVSLVHYSELMNE